MQEKITDTVTGIVDEIVFQNSDNGFTVMVLDCDGDPLTVVGVMPGVCEGEELEIQGYYTTHPNFGRQFKAVLYTQSMPATVYAIEKYLASGVIKGIGPSLAKRIVTQFGEKTFEVIEKTPELLSEVKGISKKMADAISESFMRVYGLKAVMAGLSQFGLAPQESVAVYKRFLGASLDAIRANPYVLCSSEIGVSFSRADDVASSLGYDYNDPKRIKAGCIYALDYNFEKDGHSCVPYQKLIKLCANFLSTSENDTEIELSNCIENGQLCHDFKEEKNEGFVYLPKAYFAEKYIAKRIVDILKASKLRQEKSWDKEILSLEKKLSIRYDELQKKAIRDALNYGFLVLSGGPGTGKTTTLDGIISLYEKSGYCVAIAAPTGRAAKRICEMTGYDAKTIHRLLEVQFERDEISFVHNEENPLKADVIIVDEFSMVDLMLFESLLRAMKPNARLILVGDANQLPSVGCGTLLKDLMECDYLPIVQLEHIFRQAAESLIVTNAHRIVCGEMPELNVRERDFFFLKENLPKNAADTVLSLVLTRLPKSYGFSPTADIQVLCPSKQGELGTYNLNRILQQSINPPSLEKTEHKFGDVVFRVGDKVMQNRNDYEILYKRDGKYGKGIFNGDIGEIVSIDKGRGQINILFDDREAIMSFDSLNEIEHAYAITVHKSQGSEFEAVILPLMGHHKNLHYRKLLYTAVTRARKLLIIVGQESTVKEMVETHKSNTRYSTLKRFLDIQIKEQPLL